LYRHNNQYIHTNNSTDTANGTTSPTMASQLGSRPIAHEATPVPMNNTTAPSRNSKPIALSMMPRPATCHGTLAATCRAVATPSPAQTPVIRPTIPTAPRFSWAEFTALVKIFWASPVRLRLSIVSLTKLGSPADTKPSTDTATRMSGKIERNSDSVSALAAF
jgi:hypothetical protein